MSPEEILQQVSHRPWPVPEKPWAGRMRWTNLAFLHWPLDPAVIRPYLPAGLELDTFEGQAWIGVVPFRMENTRARFAPPIPTATEFPELNVRTYARMGRRLGVWFFSLDAASALAVRGARTMFNLPYFDADMVCQEEGDGVVYRSDRVHSGAPPAHFFGTYAPSGAVYHAQPGSLDYFLTERYCLFNQDHQGRLGFLDIHHLPWPLQPATVSLEVNTMVEAAGLTLPRQLPLAHFARSLDVVAWNREAFAE